MDAYKGGMYIENRLDDRVRSMLRNGPGNASTHIQQHRETYRQPSKDQSSKIKDQQTNTSALIILQY